LCLVVWSPRAQLSRYRPRVGMTPSARFPSWTVLLASARSPTPGSLRSPVGHIFEAAVEQPVISTAARGSLLRGSFVGSQRLPSGSISTVMRLSP
jgi:hypothetical protein